MKRIVEFIYWWALTDPYKYEVLTDDGTFDVEYADHSIRAAIHDEECDSGQWLLPSNRTIYTDEVNEFLRKYII